jgi:hypothetical protein
MGLELRKYLHYPEMLRTPLQPQATRQKPPSTAVTTRTISFVVDKSGDHASNYDAIGK